MKNFIQTEQRPFARHDEREVKRNPLSHAHQRFDIFNVLANWAVDEAGGADSVFGTKPGVAGYTATDLGTEANRAVKANSANYSDIEALLNKILPGYSDMLGQGSKNTMSLLKGELPQDVQDAVRRSSAYKSLQGGFAGSGMSKALTARDFGLTSLDLMGRGENSAQRWAGLAQGSVKPFMVTAPDQAEATFRNNLYQQATEQFKYNVAAAPDPGAAGIFNLQTAMGAMAASFGMSSALGGMQSGGGQQKQWGMQGQGGNTASGMYGGASSLGNYWGGYGGG